MDWSLVGQSPSATCYPAAAASPFTAGPTAPNSPANTLSAWAEILSSMPYDGLVKVMVKSANRLGYQLFDIGFGTAGNEVAVASQLFYDSKLRFRTLEYYPFYLYAPAGTRISARTQSDQTASADNILYVALLTFPLGGFGEEVYATAVDAYGALTASSSLTSFDPGGTVDIKGAWAVMTASLTNRIKGFFLGVHGYTSAVTNHHYVDIAIGATGSEQIILLDYPMCTHVSYQTHTKACTPFFPISIPAGVQISIRLQSDINTANTRLLYLGFYGVR